MPAVRAVVAVPPVVAAVVVPVAGRSRWRRRCRCSRCAVVVARRGGFGPVAVDARAAVARPRVPSVRARVVRRARPQVEAARRQEFEQMEAPTIGGVRVRKGNGETVRLARGASLTDFAEKIGVDAASLVQMLFTSARW